MGDVLRDMSLAALTQAVEANLTAFHVVSGERFYAHHSHEELFGLFCEYEMARCGALDSNGEPS